MIELKQRAEASVFWTYASPVLALLLTVCIGLGIFVALGKDPIQGLLVFFWEPIKSTYALSELLVKATPLLLIALGLAVCFRSNVWNIGAEGQYVMGAVAAGGMALPADATSTGWMVPAVLLAGVAGGMFWAGIVAFLRDRFNANEILVSLMLVYVAIQLLQYVVYGPWKDPNGYNFPQTKTFDAVTKVPRLLDGSRVTIGLLLALIGAGAVWVYLYRTRAGFAQQVGGLAPLAARYAGFSSRRALWGALLISGAFAGLGGAGGGWPHRTTHTVCARRLWVCGHYCGLCWTAASRGGCVFCGADEHLLYRGRVGAIAVGLAQVDYRRLPRPVAVCALGLRHLDRQAAGLE